MNKLLEYLHLKRLRLEWRKTVEGKGGSCPCCGRWGRVYRRPLNATMARSLVWLCLASQSEDWVDVPKTAPRWLVQSNQLPSLRWWDLVVRLASEDEDKKHSGFWKPTPLGRAFCKGEATVKRCVYTYAGCFEKFGGADVKITDCLGEGFSYSEVMGNYE